MCWAQSDCNIILIQTELKYIYVNINLRNKK